MWGLKAFREILSMELSSALGFDGSGWGFRGVL